MNNGSLNPDWWAYFERYPLPKPYPPYEEDSSPESQSEYEDESGDDDLKQQDKSENRARQAREQHDIVEYVRQSQSNPHKNLQNQERYRRKKMDWYQDRIIAWMNESSSWTRMDDIDYYKYYNGHYKSIVDQRMLHWLQQQLLDIESKSQMAQMTQSKQCILLCELGQLLFETWMNRHRDRDNETEHSELAMHSLCSILDLPLRLSYARAYVLLADILAYSEWATSGEEAVLLHLAAMHGYSEALVRLYSNYVRCLDHDVVRIAVQEKIDLVLATPSIALVKPLLTTPIVKTIQDLYTSHTIRLPASIDEAVRLWLIPVLTRGTGISRVEDLRYRIGTLLDVIREHQDKEHYRRLLDRQFDLSCDLRLIVLQYLSSDKQHC